MLENPHLMGGQEARSDEGHQSTTKLTTMAKVTNRFWFRVLRVFVSCVVRTTTHAQTPAPGTVVFTGARVIDGTGSAPVEQATIVVTNGKITAIGPSASVTPPADAMVINVAGKTVMPGLINSHGHIDPDLSVKQPPNREEMIQRLKMYASYGVTSVMTLGFETYDEADGFYLRDMQRLGIGPVVTDAPRLYAAGRPILFRPGPTGNETADGARIDVGRHVPLKADFIKLHLDGTALDLKPDVVAAAIDEAHKFGLPVAVHIVYLKDAKIAIERGVDVIAHSVRDQDIDAATIAEMKRRNVALIPTLSRDFAVFVYESTPDFFKDPFFLRGLSIYKHEVDLLSNPARQQRMRTDAAAQDAKKQLAQGTRNLKLLSDAGSPSPWARTAAPSRSATRAVGLGSTSTSSSSSWSRRASPRCRRSPPQPVPPRG
jgi:hypothetical protein